MCLGTIYNTTSASGCVQCRTRFAVATQKEWIVSPRVPLRVVTVTQNHEFCVEANLVRSEHLATSTCGVSDVTHTIGC